MLWSLTSVRCLQKNGASQCCKGLCKAAAAQMGRGVRRHAAVGAASVKPPGAQPGPCHMGLMYPMFGFNSDASSMSVLLRCLQGSA